MSLPDAFCHPTSGNSPDSGPGQGRESGFLRPEEAQAVFMAEKPWGPVPAAPASHTWELLMEEALREAEAAAVEGEVPVGAVIVAPDGAIVARAHNQTLKRGDPTAHAEILALRKAADTLGNHRLGGAIMVVTLEPCLMCTGAIREARLAGVVYGAADRASGAVASRLGGLDLGMATPRVWHYGGVESCRCAKLLQDFFQALR